MGLNEGQQDRQRDREGGVSFIMRSTPFWFLLVGLACSAWSVVAGLCFSLLQVQATITAAFPYYSLIGQGPLLGLCNPTCATTATDNRNAASYSYKLLVIGEPFFVGCFYSGLLLPTAPPARCAACRVDSRSLVAPAPVPYFCDCLAVLTGITGPDAKMGLSISIT